MHLYSNKNITNVKAGVISPKLRSSKLNQDINVRISELVGLAEAISLQVVFKKKVDLSYIRPSSFFGKGKLLEIKEYVYKTGLEVLIVDSPLTPAQQRNLESSFLCKVIDRTGLILEIFGARAKTKEGILQVELASLQYQKGRLVRSWTHLERQRGGFGFLGGPGESQIESDRRQISERIDKIEKSLNRVVKTRKVQRSARSKIPFPIISIVGYTNSGKSTLFNLLTNSNVLSEDMLFATLDPTMRMRRLSNGIKAIFSDTVGFISGLPNELVAAFAATLEEVKSSDIIIHLCDASSCDSENQSIEVIKTLNRIGISDETPIFTVYNKIDLIEDFENYRLNLHNSNSGNVFWISALSTLGVDKLLEGIGKHLSKIRVAKRYNISSSDGASLAWLYSNSEIIKRQDRTHKIVLEVLIDPVNSAKFENYHQVEAIDHFN